MLTRIFKLPNVSRYTDSTVSLYASGLFKQVLIEPPWFIHACLQTGIVNTDRYR